MMMRTLKAVKFIMTISTEPTGAAVQRQIFEQTVIISDHLFSLLCELLVVLDFLLLLGWNFYDFWFVNWYDDLILMARAVIYHGIFPAQATG